jgi:hypothetical protein
MGRESIAPELKALLEPWLEAKVAAWAAQPEDQRVPNLPTTNDGKVNIRKLIAELKWKPSQAQHIFNHVELRTLVNAAAEVQGLAPIGSRIEADEQDAIVRNRIARVNSVKNDLAATLAERESVIQLQRLEIQSLRAQLRLRDETGMVLRLDHPC